MKMSNLFLRTHKECPLELDNEGLKQLYRAGFVKYMEDSSYSYTPLGNLFFDKMLEEVMSKFDEYIEIRINGDKNSGLNSYLGDLKSYKDLPLDIKYITKNKNMLYKYKDGLLNPRKENAIKFIKISSEEDVNISLASVDLKINKLLESLKVKTQKHMDKDGFTKYYYKCKDISREVVYCPNCSYGDLKEEAVSKSFVENSEEIIKEKEYVFTPDAKTIEEVVNYLESSPRKLIKTLLYNINDEIVAVLIRGDRKVNITLVAKKLNVKVTEIKMATEEEVEFATNSKTGFAGPIGLKSSKILCDEEVIHIKNAIIGANKTDYHIKNVNYKKDFLADCIDNYKLVEDNDSCVNCNYELKYMNGINFINVKKIKSNYGYLNSGGREEKLHILETEIYLDRLFNMIANENITDCGILWPEVVSYFDMQIIINNIKNEDEVNIAAQIYNKLSNKGHKVLIDDRKERIGFKLKDSELIGINEAIIVGKNINDGFVEYRNKREEISKNIGISELIPVE